MPVTPASPTRQPSARRPADPIAAARAIAPALRSRTAETDANRRLADDLVATMREAGLFGLMTPRRYGGAQASLQVYADVMDELAQADGSAAWVACLVNVCNYIATMLFDDATQRQLFGATGDAMIAGVLAPRTCRIRRADGGIVIEEGRWHFNSGVLHADWDLLAVPALDAAGNVVGQDLALLPIGDCEVLDEWNTIAMRGTGSTTVAVRDVFVPRARLGSMSGAVAGGNGSPHLRDEALYRTAFVPVLAIILAYPALGMARGALEAFLAAVGSRGIPYTGYARQADAVVVQVAAAEAAAKIRCATLLVADANADIEAFAARCEPMPLERRARIRLDTAYAVRLCYEAADTLASASGGSFAAEGNVLNRHWRDLRTISLHAIASAPTNLELYGRLLCGLEPNTPVV